MAPLAKPTSFEEAMAEIFAKRDASDAQRAAFEHFRAAGAPHRRLEGWRWSDFRQALRNAAPANDPRPSADLAERAVIVGFDAFLVSSVNGRVQLPGDLPTGVSCGIARASELQRAPSEQAGRQALSSLNEAMCTDILQLSIEPGVVLTKPVHIHHIVDRPGAFFSAVQTLIGADASATIVETFEASDGFASSTHSVTVGQGASVRRVVHQTANDHATVYGLCGASLAQKAVFRQTSVTTGAALSRHETQLDYIGEGVDVMLDSVALTARARHADFTSVIRHHAPGCHTRQRHKGVATGGGRTVFQGKFHVMREAQQTDADMQANALLLSEGAEANHKPELEIYADDVECAHGSTAGSLDAAALFYMRQRGLDEAAARALLIEAFVHEAVDLGEAGEIAAVLQGAVEQWLQSEASL